MTTKRSLYSMAKEKLQEEESFDVSDVVNKGDYIRKKILDNMQVDIEHTTPNVFNYIQR